MFWKTKSDILIDWVDLETMEIVSGFIREGVMDYTFTKVGSLSEWGCFHHMDTRSYIENMTDA